MRAPGDAFPPSRVDQGSRACALSWSSPCQGAIASCVGCQRETGIRELVLYADIGVMLGPHVNESDNGASSHEKSEEPWSHVALSNLRPW